MLELLLPSENHYIPLLTENECWNCFCLQRIITFEIIYIIVICKHVAVFFNSVSIFINAVICYFICLSSFYWVQLQDPTAIKQSILVIDLTV